MLVTVFTPTYNRAYCLPALYDSLQRQTCKDFEWLIIDDGSSDNTDELAQEWLKEDSFHIRYFKQKNGGKHRAVNRGVSMAKGELFYIVDSDDILPDNSLELISLQYKNISHEPSFAGVCGLKAGFDGHLVSRGADFDTLDCTSLEIRSKYRVVGDLAEVFKTTVLKEFPFPVFDGEKFCPEALVFNRIALKYRLRFFSEIVYLCEYRNDGLTSSIDRIRMKSPQATSLCYWEFFHCPIPLKLKLRYAINYWRFFFCKVDKKNCKPFNSWAVCLAPLGYLYHLYDLYRYERV